jgi:hypothetical protein
VVTVIGMWEPGYTLEQTFIEDTVWKQTLSAYAVDRFIMVTYPDVRIDTVSSPEQYDTMEDALNSTTGERVFLSYPVEWSVLLRDFTHPPDAVYVFGRPGDDLSQYIRPEDHKIHIQTTNNVDMLGCSCVAAVLYARSL